MARSIEYNSNASIGLDDVRYPIRMVEKPFEPNQGYGIRDFEIEGFSGNGCLFDIKQFRSTRQMLITDSGLVSQRTIVSGSGYYLGVDPNGIVRMIALDAARNDNPIIELRKGWVDCFIAGRNGMTIVDISMPPFGPEMEMEIVRGDINDHLPSRFWQRLDELTQRT